MAFPQGTTPTFILTLPEEYDLSDAEHVCVTFQTFKGTLTKQDESLDIDGNTVSVFLSQEETMNMERNVNVQVNWTYDDGSRWASEVVHIPVDEQLLRAVIE